jgi:hypothetical protein
MAFHLQPKWRPLIGQLVIVVLQDDEIRRGVVDAVTDDDQILWLDGDGAEHRVAGPGTQGTERHA